MIKNEALRRERDIIVKGLELAYKKLVAQKRQNKSPMIVWLNGEIVAIDPEKVKPETIYKRGSVDV